MCYGQTLASIQPFAIDEFITDGFCRGFVTVDVLEKGLSRGAIATG